MKLKKYYKYCLALCFILLAFILFILLNSNITLFKSKKNSSNNKDSINMALIIPNNMNKDDLNQLTKCLDLCGDSFDKSYEEFKVSDYSDSYEDTIKAATSFGATFIICPDSSFEETVYNLQTSYPSVYFLLVDGFPHNGDFTDSTINFNVIPMVFDDSEAGFLAGYSAAYEGYESLAFVGLENNLQSIKYCYGFLQGVDYAADELDKSEIKISISYTKAESSSDVSDNLYKSGTELIVACGNTIIENVTKSAEKNKKYLIACGDNHPQETDCLIANSTKNIYYAVNDCVSNFYNNEKIAGNTQIYSATENAIALNYKSSNFKHFDSKIYDSVYLKLSYNEIQLISDTTISPEDLELPHIKITKS